MNYTSIEQSKKLLELGLSPESADMTWNDAKITNGEPTAMTQPYSKYKGFFNVSEIPSFLIPCWSVGALLELFPVEYKVENALFDQTGKFTYSIELPRYRWRTYENENLIDVCFEAAVWLLENNYIKKKD